METTSKLSNIEIPSHQSYFFNGNSQITSPYSSHAMSTSLSSGATPTPSTITTTKYSNFQPIQPLISSKFPAISPLSPSITPLEISLPATSIPSSTIQIPPYTAVKPTDYLTSPFRLQQSQSISNLQSPTSATTATSSVQPQLNYSQSASHLLQINSGQSKINGNTLENNNIPSQQNQIRQPQQEQQHQERKPLRLEELSSQFVLLCAENERLSFAYLLKERDISNLTNQVNQLQSSQTSQEQLLKTANIRIDALQQTNIELQNKANQYLLRIDELTTHLNHPSQFTQQAELIQARHEIQSLNGDMQHLRERLNKQISASTLHLQNSHEITQKDSALIVKNKEISELKKYINALEGDIDVIKEKFQKSESEQSHETVSVHADQLQKLQDNLELLLNENNILQTALLSRIEEIELLKSLSKQATTELDQKVQSLSSENLALKSQQLLPYKQSEHQELVFELQQLKSTLSFQDHHITELTRKIEESAASQHKQSTQMVNESELSKQELEKLVQELSQECNQLRSKYSQMDTYHEEAILELRTKIRNETINEYTNQLTTLQLRLETSEAQRDQAVGRLGSIEYKLNMSESQVKDLISKLHTLNGDLENHVKVKVTTKEKLEECEKQLLSVAEKHLLIRIENERLHGVLNRIQSENDTLKLQIESRWKQQQGEVVNKVQELEEIHRTSKRVIAEQQREIERLSKLSESTQASYLRKQEHENQVLHLNRELETTKLKLLESEKSKHEFSFKCNEYSTALHKLQSIDQQANFLARENQRLQKLIMERCRQSTSLW